MRVEHLMSAPVVITQRNVRVDRLKELFSRKRISAVPVLEEDGTITGIVSSSDLVRCNDSNMTVQDIMSDRVHIVLKNNRMKDAAAIMGKNNVHHLVVMDEGDVVGMISSMDVVKLYADE